jgi:excisionase family DNA binding protein
MTAVTITQITPPELELLIQNSLQKILNSHQPQASQPEAEVLTVPEAAKFLRLSVQTVYSLISKGQLPFVMKRSKRCYFSKSDLLEYLKQGRKETLADAESSAVKYLVKKKKG